MSTAEEGGDPVDKDEADAVGRHAAEVGTAAGATAGAATGATAGAQAARDVASSMAATASVEAARLAAEVAAEAARAVLKAAALNDQDAAARDVAAAVSGGLSGLEAGTLSGAEAGTTSGAIAGAAAGLAAVAHGMESLANSNQALGENFARSRRQVRVLGIATAFLVVTMLATLVAMFEVRSGEADIHHTLGIVESSTNPQGIIYLRTAANTKAAVLHVILCEENHGDQQRAILLHVPPPAPLRGCP